MNQLFAIAFLVALLPQFLLGLFGLVVVMLGTVPMALGEVRSAWKFYRVKSTKSSESAKPKSSERVPPN